MVVHKELDDLLRLAKTVMGEGERGALNNHIETFVSAAFHQGYQKATNEGLKIQSGIIDRAMEVVKLEGGGLSDHCCVFDRT